MFSCCSSSRAVDAASPPKSRPSSRNGDAPGSGASGGAGDSAATPPRSRDGMLPLGTGGGGDGGTVTFNLDEDGTVVAISGGSCKLISVRDRRGA